jgi:hypothetical protein
MAVTKAQAFCTSSSRLTAPRITSTSGICATGLKKCMPTSRPGSAKGWAMSSIMIDEVLVASTAPGFSLPSIDLNRFCFTSNRSTMASITTSARWMFAPA